MFDQYDQLLTPLTNGWIGKIDEAAKKKRAQFGNVADQCMMFFSGVVGQMYDPKFQSRFIGGDFNPKFKITLNKAFEMVALFGPLIYNRNPNREVNPPDSIEYGPEVFGDPNDPSVQETHKHVTYRDYVRRKVLATGCQVLERYLNYTPNEQPNGGLKQASEDACTEALVKGRGVLWTEAYQPPGSNRILTGSFYDTVDHLQIDPDAESSNFGEAYWISRLCVEPHWKVERDRGLPYGSLRNKNGIESSESLGAQSGNANARNEKQRGTTFDLIRYWKIWSIGGVGTRLTGTSKLLQEAFDDVVGDYAYLEVARGVPYPLNMPTEKFVNATDDDVRRAFAWPVPYWKDSRWPCSMLDFYRQPRSAWPISPLRPGLGELVALNVIMSRLTFNIYQNTRQIIAVLKSAKETVEAELRSTQDEVVVSVPEILKDINSTIQYLKGPGVNYDVWKIIEHLFLLFDKRVGLTELMYSMNPGAASRTSDDAQTKQQMLAIRPDYLRDKVGDWQADVARNEKICAYYSGVNGDTVQPLVGDAGAFVFEQTFVNIDEETMLREMNATITEGSAGKPSHERDTANLQQVYQPLSQQLGQYAANTGDTEPLNALNRRLCKAMKIDDAADLAMGPMSVPQPPDPNQPPPPSPKDMAAIAAKEQEMQVEAAQAQQEMIIKDAEHRQKTQQDAEKHAADMMVALAKARIERMKKSQLPKAA